jgi:tetratricopeptide (TPR) repeat protein
MPEGTSPPVIFLASANDRQADGRFLRNLAQEMDALRRTLRGSIDAGHCLLVERQSSTPDQILEVFREYARRVAIFHYAGHADDYALLLETIGGRRQPTEAGPLAAFFKEQPGLKLVFLNACSTHRQAIALIDAGVPVVIATSRAVDDALAARFAGQFYAELAAGRGIEAAFAAAGPATRLGAADLARHLTPAADPLAEHGADGLPWALYARPGAEADREWSLPAAADDLLFGLPPLPPGDLPADPYRSLQTYTAGEHAEIFFGRDRETRDLYHTVTDPDGPPIVLLYGQSGVGKSSLLDAGLCPRLASGYEVRYRRRRPDGLPATLHDALGDPSPDAWRAEEARAGRPVVLILDQVEEAFTRPAPEPSRELGDLLAALRSLLGEPGAARPRGKLVLGFRKEWLPEIERHLKEARLPAPGKLFLDRLARAGIIAAVKGPARPGRLARHYGLAVAPGLAEEIADDLLADPGSPVATVLAILMTRLWTQATGRDRAHPVFDRALYLETRQQGIGLDDFLGQALAALHSWQPRLVDSGLVLDLLAAHTTPLGTADEKAVAALVDDYGHLALDGPKFAGKTPAERVAVLLQQAKDRYLLAEGAGDRVAADGRTRLAHDTLAPLVRRRFDQSDAPGPRARRILANRAPDWDGARPGTPLDDQDLALVEQGRDGMRAWTPPEGRLVAASRQERNRRRRVRRLLQGLGAAAVLLIALSAGVAWWQAGVAQAERARAEQRFDDVQQLATNLLFEVHDSVANLAGATEARDLIVRRGQEYLDKLAREAGDDRALQLTLVEAYLRLGDVQGGLGSGNLGDVARALDSYNEALTISQRLIAANPDDAAIRRYLGVSHERVGDGLMSRGDTAEALMSYQQALAIADGLAAADLNDSGLQLNVSVVHMRIGDALRQAGDLPGARQSYERALAMHEKLAASAPNDVRFQRDIAVSHERIGDLLAATDQLDEARARYERALEISDRLAAAEPHDVGLQRNLAFGHERIADMLERSGDLDGAVVRRRQVLPIREHLAAADPRDALAQHDLNYSYGRLGEVLHRQGERAEALDYRRKGLAIANRLAQLDPNRADWQQNLDWHRRAVEELSRP